MIEVVGEIRQSPGIFRGQAFVFLYRSLRLLESLFG
jgi:hypothetical protein